MEIVEITGDADEYVEIDPETDAIVTASAVLDAPSAVVDVPSTVVDTPSVEDLQLLASKTGVLESGEPSIEGGDGSLVKESEQ